MEESRMERGRHFFLTLAAGLIATTFIISGLCIPSQMVFELKPFARVVLQSGNLDNWTAASLHLDQDKFDDVKSNYQAYLKASRNNGDDDSDDDSSVDGEDSSSSDSDSDMVDREGFVQHSNDTGTIDETPAGEYHTLSDTGSTVLGESSESSDSSDSSEEQTLEDRLQDVPMDQTVRLGLFVSKVCTVSQGNEERCVSVPVSTGMRDVIDAAAFTERVLTMPFWNNVRMESIFALIAAVGGVACLLASLRKACCSIEKTPFYLGAVSFFAAGVLAFIPVIRIAMLSSDLQENLTAKLNVTTQLRMPWSILLYAFGGTFAFISLVSLVFGDWCHVRRRLYNMLSHNAPTGNDVMLHNVPTGGSLGTNGHADGVKDSEKTQALVFKP